MLLLLENRRIPFLVDDILFLDMLQPSAASKYIPSASEFLIMKTLMFTLLAVIVITLSLIFLASIIVSDDPKCDLRLIDFVMFIFSTYVPGQTTISSPSSVLSTAA